MFLGYRGARLTPAILLPALLVATSALFGCSPESDDTTTAESAKATPGAERAKPAETAKSAEPPAPAEVSWKAYEEGLAEAKNSGKPVMLVFYTEWCPHCRNYEKVFHDPTFVETSKKFVMIRLDKDKNPELSRKYAPDGEYIPRTFFLKSDGTLLADVTEQRPKYKYFYNENDPQAVLRSMNAVLAMPAQG